VRKHGVANHLRGKSGEMDRVAALAMTVDYTRNDAG
jgi:hypothetical protein